MVFSLSRAVGCGHSRDLRLTINQKIQNSPSILADTKHHLYHFPCFTVPLSPYFVEKVRYYFLKFPGK